MLVIGSWALNQCADLHSISRNGFRDIDLIGTEGDFDIFTKFFNATVEHTGEYKVQGTCSLYNRFEFEFVEKRESSKLYYDYCKDLKLYDSFTIKMRYAPKEVLYSLKASHIYYPIQFEKNISDYNTLHKLCNQVDVLEDITKLRRKETEQYAGKLKTPSLNKSCSEFFDDNAMKIRVFDHDDMHRVMAYYDKPLFMYMQENYGESVSCSKDMWNMFPEINKIRCVLEEAYVIALERIMIPALFLQKPYVHHKSAFKWALMRICTNLCSGWFRKYAVDNYFSILDEYDDDYVVKFLRAVDKKEISRIENEELEIV